MGGGQRIEGPLNSERGVRHAEGSEPRTSKTQLPTSKPEPEIGGLRVLEASVTNRPPPGDKLPPLAVLPPRGKDPRSVR
jgi:hypothetical protein